VGKQLQREFEVLNGFKNNINKGEEKMKRLILIPLVILALTGCTTVPVIPTTNVQQSIIATQRVLDGFGIALTFAPIAVSVLCTTDPKDCDAAKKILVQANASYKVAQVVLSTAQVASTDPTSDQSYVQALTALIDNVNTINDLIISFGGTPLPTSAVQLKRANLSLKR
jgi:hypothetical protein